MNWIDKKEEIQAWIEKNQPEVYWDYRDELSDKDIAKIIEDEDGLSAVEDEIWEMNIDYICELERQCIKNVAEEFDFDEDILEDDEFVDFCRDFICVDLCLKDLLRKTRDVVVFYDTGVSTSGYGQSEKDYIREMKEIKKFLKIKMSDTTHDDKIMMMIHEAGYGGQFVLYFTIGLDELLKRDDNNTILFHDVNVAIVDHGGGSGADCFLSGLEFSVPLDRDKIFYEKGIKYNYTYAVCGMSSDWCDGTQWEFTKKYYRKPLVATKSATTLHKEREAAYNKTFSEGGCTYGDMDIQRHRDTRYHNTYPCGTHCPHCGTFWID